VSCIVLKIPLLFSHEGIGCCLNQLLFANKKKFLPGAIEESICSVIGSELLKDFSDFFVELLHPQKIIAGVVNRRMIFFIWKMITQIFKLIIQITNFYLPFVNRPDRFLKPVRSRPKVLYSEGLTLLIV
jgi:hypothetical protein